MPKTHDEALILYELVVAALPDSAKAVLEGLMDNCDYEFKSRFARTHTAIGKAEGMANALVEILDTRGIHVPDDIKARITGCTDLEQLNIWIRRAAAANTVNDLLGWEYIGTPQVIKFLARVPGAGSASS